MLKKILLIAAVLALPVTGAQAQNIAAKKKSQPVVAEYDFQQKEYKKCLEQVVTYTAPEYVECLNAEIARQNAAINWYYDAFLKYPEFKKWNNGNGMFRGNLKDMNDQYSAYRERLCSLNGLALYQTYGDLEYGRKDCVKDINEQFLRRLERMYNGSQVDFGPDVDAIDPEKGY